ncbi:MAG: cation transporter, partial [Lautropia sp.]|nr:cation transporter [Lautropia sp.]
HDHDHDHGRAGGGRHVEAGGHGHADLNLRAAYIHVLADAATSILAIVALFGGKWWGADWLDPLMGMVGAVLVAVWARGLLADCARVLLDAEMDAPVVGRIRAVLAGLPVPLRLDDLHVWRVAHDRHACIVALSLPAQAGGGAGLGEASAAAATRPQGAALPTADEIRQRLACIPSLVHVTVELNRA